MRFTHLEITDFRNLSSVKLSLAPGLNVFFGDNGAGKTALLEAVHVLCRGRSFRTQKSLGLIRHGCDELVVRGSLEDEFRGRTTLGISKARSARTELRLNGRPERRLSEIARLTPLQVMLPDIGDLVFGGPAKRRSWLDWGTFHVKPDYLAHLRDYLRAIRQRNVLLRDGAQQHLLRPWNDEAARLGGIITLDREAYLSRLAPHFRTILAVLAPELTVTLSYQQGWPKDRDLHKLLGEGQGREVKYGATLWGPQRADVQLRATDAAAHAPDAGDAPAGTVLSRGQGKMVASALQMAQAALLAETEQRTTVFLIDDAGAELDAAHNERFFRLLAGIGGQILATTTRDPREGGGRDGLDRMTQVVFHVEHGSVTRMAN